MKTAISVPNPTFERADRVARRHGLNRSQFYSAAAEYYADHLERAQLTEQINAAVDIMGADDSAEFAVRAGRRRLASDEW